MRDPRCHLSPDPHQDPDLGSAQGQGDDPGRVGDTGVTPPAPAEHILMLGQGSWGGHDSHWI